MRLNPYNPSPFFMDSTINVRPPIWALMVAVALGGMFYIGGKYVEKRNIDPITITVSGEGKVAASPDLAMLSLGVQTGRQPTSEAAMTMLKKNMDAIIAAVKKAGVDDKDISTENFWLNPAYDWTDKGQVPRGFEANQSIRVKVRNLDKASEILGAATAAGANQAGGIQFTIDEPEKLRGEAREKAIAQAKEKAELLAKNLGMTLGNMRGFVEGGASMPPMMYDRAMAVGMGGGMSEASAVPLPAGEQEINMQVSLTYELN